MQKFAQLDRHEAGDLNTGLSDQVSDGKLGSTANNFQITFCLRVVIPGLTVLD